MKWGRRTGMAGGVGLLCITLGYSCYWIAGFSPWIGLLLGSGYAALIWAAFQLQPLKLPRLGRRDWLCLLAPAIIFAPLYLYRVHDYPVQMNTDEIAILMTVKHEATTPKVNIMGPTSYYFGLPSLIFWTYGKLCLALGGVTLTNLRILNAIAGVFIILATYLLCRQVLKRNRALLATIVVASCHSLFFISRLAMRDNTALLFELIALNLLFYGWRQRHYGWTLLGGMAAGLTFYTYYPSRMTIILWGIFVAGSLLVERRTDRRRRFQLGIVAAVTCGVVAMPVIIPDLQSLHSAQSDYAREALLVTHNGKDLQKLYVSDNDLHTAIVSNRQAGLLTFNRAYTDKGYVYVHNGYGFVDHISGVLIWIGLAAVLISAGKVKRLSEAQRLMVVSFLVIWLTLALLVTRAPDYTRVSIALPFIGYLVAEGTGGVAVLLQVAISNRWKPHVEPTVLLFIGLLIVATNALIVRDFIRQGNLHGDAVGSTYRFQEQQAHQPASWFFAPTTGTSYYRWDDHALWTNLLSYPKGDQQPLTIISPNERVSTSNVTLPIHGTGYLLTDASSGKIDEAYLRQHFTQIDVINLTPDKKLVALEFYNR